MTKVKTDVDITIKPDDIANAFKFEPGEHIYLVEVKTDSMLTRDDLAQLSKKFANTNIKVQFVMTGDDDFSMRAVPAVEKKD